MRLWQPPLVFVVIVVVLTAVPFIWALIDNRLRYGTWRSGPGRGRGPMDDLSAADHDAWIGGGGPP